MGTLELGAEPDAAAVVVWDGAEVVLVLVLWSLELEVVLVMWPLRPLKLEVVLIVLLQWVMLLFAAISLIPVFIVYALRFCTLVHR
jgi:hypothetical protein